MARMVVSDFYISQPGNLLKAMNLTLLSKDEIEHVVGRFHDQHERAGQLKGRVIEYADGEVKIIHHFNKKKLWSNVE